MITKSKMGFYKIRLKLANMRNEQEFTLYPSVNNDMALLQSDKRIIRVNIVTGIGIINNKNEQNGAYAPHLTFNTLPIKLDDNTCKNLQGHYIECPAGSNEVKSGDTVILTF